MRGRNSGPVMFCGTGLGGEVCGRPGERPAMPLSKRVDMALRTYRHMLWRAARGDFSEPWCTSIPAYSGGDNGRLVAVDGAMRDPACFGSQGEPWAQLGYCDCGDTSDVLDRVVDVGPEPRRYEYLAPMLAR